MQQNISSLVKDIKVFTLTESKTCGEKKSAKSPTKECQSVLQSNMFVDNICQNSLEFRFWEKPSLKNNLVLFIHQVMKANK